MMHFIRQLLEWLISVFTTPLIRLDENVITVFSLLLLVVALILIVLAMGLVKRFLKHRILSPLNLDASNREVIATIASYGFGAIATIVALQNLGFQLTSLGIILGGLGVGIGFGLQTITNDFVSGLIVLFERNLKVNDFIELDDHNFSGLMGTIQEVKLRSTIIRTLDNGDVVIPNNELISRRILNWSYESPVSRLRLPVGIVYGSDPMAVTETLLKAAYLEPAVLSEPMPKVFFQGFGEESLDFELWVWVEFSRRFDVQSALNFTIEYLLRQQGLELACAQHDIWVRSSEDLIKRLIERQERTSAPTATAPKPPPHPPALRDLLRSVSYFEQFSDLELRRLIEIGHHRRLLPNTVLFREGDSGDAFYIVLEGQVDIIAETTQATLASLGAGQFFGEVALLLGIPRTATAKTVEPTLVFVIHRQGFSLLLHQYPQLADAILQALEHHQQELAERQQQLRADGIDIADTDANPVLWASRRLKEIFSL
ncbi:mechanosensitive ion channel protein MscS [Halomicronema hongdechloris C2206]|uniref:Mechanosensitive ion channel protein MscS n=1 Tax=Halomicronema hongdechloris C2206 TaxID=1641165 RepID=A0A1Z3HNF6_9CYAN|nr:cyclic nucleotide-binding domain-containing protein [Halomicronema hongdechloris]ASC71687.1 mechanosensitive ion channel protein MscS [Halomicronema hongdechloris C2206]